MTDTPTFRYARQADAPALVSLIERAYRSPGPGEQEEQFCQMTTRQWNNVLERQFGIGHTLVLVDAQEARSARDQVYGRRAAGAVPAPSYPRFLVNEICLVADREVPADGLARFQQDNPTVRWRLVNLPNLPPTTHAALP